jgi:hypothetical protein
MLGWNFGYFTSNRLNLEVSWLQLRANKCVQRLKHHLIIRFVCSVLTYVVDHELMRQIGNHTDQLFGNTMKNPMAQSCITIYEIHDVDN